MKVIRIDTELLAENDKVAAQNRDLFRSSNLYVLNLMSGPGAGKTTLLEKTIRDLKGKFRFMVIAGDIETCKDAERIERQGAMVYQINTGGACHLDARMINHTIHDIDLSQFDAILIENVGNLVCPAEFYLGEDDRVMILSVTEGDDKPSKYPLMFSRTNLMIINKIDLLPYTNFDYNRAVQDARVLNPELKMITMSALSGEGFDKWIEWLEMRIKTKG